MFWRRKRSNPLEYTPGMARASDLQMTINDVFVIQGRGTVATGTVERGSVGVGDSVLVVAPDGSTTRTTCTGVEAFRTKLDRAGAGDNVGVMLADIDRESVATGSVLRAAP